MFRILLFIALIGFMFSCEFEPTDVSFTELPPPTVDGTSLEVQGYEEGDTIIVYRITLVKYTIDVGDNKFVSVVAKMGNLEVEGSTEGVYLNPQNTVGYFPLKLTLTMTSGYNSLGSTKNSDRVSIARNYVAHVVTTPPASRVGEENIAGLHE